MPIEITNIHDAKTHLSRLVRRAAAGEEIVIGRAGEPMAKLVPYRPQSGPREGGQWRGQVWVADDFNAPDAGLERLFTGEGE
jgi:prevent-host-death family protein